jgi:signal transduction histidine kinase
VALDPDELSERLLRIEEQSVHMAQMIDDLLDVARLQAGRPLELRREPCDLVALVHKTAADVQRTSDRHHLQVIVEDDPIVGELDGGRIERVVLNLLTNAVKYSPDGGEITLTVRREPDGWARVDVHDQGIGIPPADLPRIFERFYRASNVGEKLAGTGLGLAGARQIVELHGGEIGAASELGQGTTLTIRLPLAP